MNIDIERLKHDREYWDECDPSSGEATHYDGGSSMDYPSFMKLENGKCAFWNADTNSWKYYHGQGSHLYIPRPAKQWSGDGLPPVGVGCEYRPDPKLDEWQWCIFIGVIGTEAFVLTGDDVVDRMKASVPGRFRPLKSEKDRVVEAAAKLCSDTLLTEHCAKQVAETLYDAGALKMPEGE